MFWADEVRWHGFHHCYLDRIQPKTLELQHLHPLTLPPPFSPLDIILFSFGLKLSVQCMMACISASRCYMCAPSYQD